MSQTTVTTGGANIFKKGDIVFTLVPRWSRWERVLAFIVAVIYFRYLDRGFWEFVRHRRERHSVVSVDSATTLTID